MTRQFCKDDIVKHFKRELCSEDELQVNENKYLYKIICFAKNTETDEMMVVYESLYIPRASFVRPVSMFMSEVDSNKYPEIKQRYRFELMTQSC